MGKRKKRGRKKTRSAAQRAATRKLVALSRSRRSARRNPAKRGRRGASKSGSKKTRRSKRKRSYPITLKGPLKGRFTANRRRKSRRNATPNKRRRSRRNVGMAIPNRRKKSSRRKARRNPMYGMNPMYQMNRRKKHRKHGRRRARRNPAILANLKGVFIFAAKATVGLLGHRALTYLLSEKGLSKIAALNEGKVAQWRATIAGGVVAIAGIAASSMLPSGLAQPVGAGVAVSFIHQLLLQILKVADQPEVAGYLAAYPDNDGSAYHTMRGYGAYEVMPPNGYGYYNSYQGYGNNLLEQAAAGYGNPLLEQAAAGYGMGSYELTPAAGIEQAAAGYRGYGQSIEQAAAGMGEYLATNLQGYGEYEAVNGYGNALGMVTREGIMPDLHSAERALNVAEAAAGVGMRGYGDLPMESTVNPMQIAAPIEDAPQGSRAGILYGRDGVFNS